MSQKAKSYYVSVIDKTKTIFHKQYLTVQEANAALKEMKEKYPQPYIVLKETY